MLRFSFLSIVCARIWLDGQREEASPLGTLATLATWSTYLVTASELSCVHQVLLRLKSQRPSL